MRKLAVLTSHPRFALQGLYCFLILLILLFLIFSAVSGPGTKYYWLVIILKTDAKTHEAGATWSLGGLGACSGDICTRTAPYGTTVMGCLMWHLAVAVIFLALGITQSILVLRPPSCNPIVVSWITLFLPPISYLFILITLITDFAVRASISGSDSVESVKTQPSFWLSTVAAVSGALWVGVAEYVMWRERNRGEGEEEEEEEPKKAGFVARLNPWG